MGDTPTNNLWIGNLCPNVTDSDLMGLFGKYGAIDATAYSSRSFGFAYFKRVEDAKAALQFLQGSVVKGVAIKIEFARPAKPCNFLWVGGISSAVSKEDLEKEFGQFGKIEEFKFLRDRNTALVEYNRVEDASEAMRSMNGKRIGGEFIRVDYLRSQSSRKEQLIDSRDKKSGQVGRGAGLSDVHFDLGRVQHSVPSGGWKGDDQPSNVLWVGYPPSFQIDEQMLHNAMILFGEIEGIKSFPSRHYAFVEFRSVEEARRAKEGLQGRLFNDPRITIMFSSSELAPGSDYPVYNSATRGLRPDMLLNEIPYRPAHMDMFGPNRSTAATSFNGARPHGSNVPMRPVGHSFAPLLPLTDINDLSTRQNMQDGVGPNWRRQSSPMPVMLPIQGVKRNGPGLLGLNDANRFERESKRMRSDGGSLPIDDRILGHEQSHGLGLVQDGGVGPAATFRGLNRQSPIDVRATAVGYGQTHVDNDCIWRGVIAKGGTPVCHARCVAIGRGLEHELPEIVNCSARTGLDMLTKHYAEAIGFDVVFFLPDSEDDFASYTEFLHYLGAKDRAGVAKLDDGTTLFLVPPSDFLKNILKVAGPERLYGVVLKFSHQLSGGDIVQQQPLPSVPPFTNTERQLNPQYRNFQIAPSDEHLMPADNQHLRETSRHTLKPCFPPPSPSQPPTMKSAAQEFASSNNVSFPQSGLALTPDLIASLTSLLPANAQSCASESSQLVLDSTNSRPTFPVSGPPDKRASLYGWVNDHSAPKSASQLDQVNAHTRTAQFQAYSVSNASSHSGTVASGVTKVQDFTAMVPQQGLNPSRPPSLTAASHTGQFAAAPPASQQYHVQAPSNLQGYTGERGTDAPLSYISTSLSQHSSTMVSSGQVHCVNVPPSQQAAAPVTRNTELPNQIQHIQSALAGGSQGSSSEAEADKNQRFQSTLQFAASLLFQIQQRQQQQSQSNSTGGQGSGNLQ